MALGLDAISFSLLSESGHRFGHLQMFLEISIEAEGDGITFGKSVKRTLAQDDFTLPISIPALPATRQSESSEVASYGETVLLVTDELESLEAVKLSPITVIGRYVRWDDRIRVEIKERMSSIISGLKHKSAARSNFLIWGPSGSGKSFFVDEVAKALGEQVDYQPINILDLEKSTAAIRFDECLRKINLEKKPVLCFVDEIDGDAGAYGIYDQLCKKLDAFHDAKIPVVCIVAGSAEGGLDAMRKKIVESNGKGTDLLTRIPANNHFEIPMMSRRDQVAVFGSHVLRQMREVDANLQFVEIEKLALFWILLSDDYRPARRLADLAAQAVQRSGVAPLLHLEHLFDSGSDRVREICHRYRSVVRRFGKVVCRIEE
jgi:predicted AAA+ superfamily ATPase